MGQAPEGSFDDNRVCGPHTHCTTCFTHTLEYRKKVKGTRHLVCTVCGTIVENKHPEARGAVWHTVWNGYSTFECNWAKGTIWTEDADG